QVKKENETRARARTARLACPTVQGRRPPGNNRRRLGEFTEGSVRAPPIGPAGHVRVGAGAISHPCHKFKHDQRRGVATWVSPGARSAPGSGSGRAPPPPITADQPERGSCPQACSAARTLLCLPFWPSWPFPL